jgi:hypothetical protein
MGLDDELEQEFEARRDDATTAENGDPPQGKIGPNPITRDRSMPTPLDALGRDLLALRAMAAGLVAMIDATFTNYRIVQVQHDSVDGLDTTGAGSSLALDMIARAVGRGASRERQERPKFFGEKQSHQPTTGE